MVATISPRQPALPRFARPAHGAIARHHHAGLVRCPRGACVRSRRSGLQRGEVPELLPAHHLRILLRQVLRRLRFPASGIRSRASSAEAPAAWSITSVTTRPRKFRTPSMQALSKVGTLSPSLTEPYTLLCTYTVQIILSILTALIGVIIAYGAIGATRHWFARACIHSVDGLRQDRFLFWGWLKAFVGFEFYKVVAAATMSVMSHLLITYFTSGANNVADPSTLITLMPGLLILCACRRLHPAQNSNHDGIALLRPCRRPRHRHGRTDYRRHSQGDLETMEAFK